MPSRILALSGFSPCCIQAALVILARGISRDKNGCQLQWLLSSIDQLVMFALGHPKCGVFEHNCLLALMNADASAGHDIDQFRTVMDVIVRAPIRREDGMAEGELFDPFLVRSEQYLNLPLKRSWNFDSFFFRGLDDFQLINPF